MKIGLYENYKFINLSGGSSSTPPPTGNNETNKLRRSIKKLGGFNLPNPPPPGNLHSV